MRDDDNSPISASEAKTLFAGWRDLPALVLAVSGGPDSVALMWLAARWRKGFARGPQLIAVTIDHGLRKEAAREAREVKRLARSLEIEHRTLRWTGDKPSRGVPAAARDARYRLLAQAARAARATHVATAHTRDDQAETLLMRLFRGSGIAGLSANGARERARRHSACASIAGRAESAADCDPESARRSPLPTIRPTAIRRSPGRGCARCCRCSRPKAAMRAGWRDWRRGWRGPMPPWKCSPMAPSAIWRSGLTHCVPD